MLILLVFSKENLKQGKIDLTLDEDGWSFQFLFSQFVVVSLDPHIQQRGHQSDTVLYDNDVIYD
jgi:hypothetical protein